MTYSGDGGERNMVVGDKVRVGINHSGELVFGSVPNPKGDFTVEYDKDNQGSLNVEQAKIKDKGSFHDGHPYGLTFTDNAGTMEVSVSYKDENGDPQATPAQAYVPGQPIKVDGVEIVVKGEAKSGDNITLSSGVTDGTGEDQLNVFDVLNRAKDWLEKDGHNSAGQSEMADVLAELDAVANHLTRVRADTGNRMQRIENQQLTHEDMGLTLNKLRSGMEDLDYAKATGEFSQTMVALQATQSMFGKVQNMSLFNYI